MDLLLDLTQDNGLLVQLYGPFPTWNEVFTKHQRGTLEEPFLGCFSQGDFSVLIESGCSARGMPLSFTM